jgi:shikimate 5-dehydrogenase
MKPTTTPLLDEAGRLGRRIHRGHHMLDNQVGLYAEFLGFGALPRRAPG